MSHRLLPILLALVCWAAGPAAALADEQAEEAGHGADRSAIPDFSYAEVIDGTDVPDVPERTVIRRAYASTMVATTWYRAWNGRIRAMLVAYPRNPGLRRIPLLINFHGAGGFAACPKRFRDVPGRYRFAVVCLDGQGPSTRGFSYADARHLADHAAIPRLLRERLPRLRIDRRRIVAGGSSMGGQEALAFAARYPTMLSAVIAVDAPADLGERYWHLSRAKQHALVADCGGTPTYAPGCYAERSPLHLADRLAASSLGLHLYWSARDAVNRPNQMPALARAIRAANPARAFTIRIGTWNHGGAWSPRAGNTEWLADVGLIPDGERAATRFTAGLRVEVDAETWTDDLPAFDG